jgi:lambda family phage portal protein
MESNKKTTFFEKAIGFISPEYALKRAHYKDLLEFSYDAANPGRTGKSLPSITTNSSSESLSNQRDRIKLMSEARNLVQNYSFFKSILNKESMYVCGQVKYQAGTGDPYTDNVYEQYWNAWTKKCDITGRHSFRQLVQLAHMSMRRDGDFAFLLVNVKDQLKLQSIEADRIGHPHEASKPKENYISGVKLDDYGAPVSYKVFRRSIHGQYTNGTDIPSKVFIHYFDPLRADQYRGVTAFETAIPHARDLYELLAMEKQAVKWAASHAGVITKTDQGPDKWASKVSRDTENKKLEKVDPGKIVRLQPGESITPFQTMNRPSPTFNGFVATLVREMANGLNLPYAFVWDMTQFGGVTARLEVEQARRAFDKHQQNLIERVLDPIKNAVIRRAIARGELPMTPNKPNAYKNGRWQFGSYITADLGNEVNANISLIQNGLKTHQACYGELGLDFEEEATKIAKEVQFLNGLAAQYGIPIELINNRLQNGTQMISQYQQMIAQQQQAEQQQTAQGGEMQQQQQAQQQQAQ